MNHAIEIKSITPKTDKELINALIQAALAGKERER